AALAIASGTGEVDAGETELRFLLRYSPAGHGGEARWTVRPDGEADAGSRTMASRLSSCEEVSSGASLYHD
ncbi:MAG: hypothetical protein L6Q69_15705, partial [Zoogloea sp.]|nr:hypothetical protein [Zoogloea sp.]